jgi:hypothetical protein
MVLQDTERCEHEGRMFLESGISKVEVFYVENWIPEGEAAVCDEYKGKKVIGVT